MDALLVLILFLLAGVVLYALYRNKPSDIDSPKTFPELAQDCTHRLRAVVREDLVTPSDVRRFLESGNKRMVIVTNIDPEAMVRAIRSGNKGSLSQIKALAIRSALVNNSRTFIVLSLANGMLNPIGAPTNDYTQAFNYLDSNIRQTIGPGENNLALYVDEDLPCPAMQVEKCCGRRF